MSSIPPILRPGRFDRRIVVNRPDVRGRDGILRVHTKKVPLGPDVDLEVLARGTPGFVGADLENLVNEAALLAARQDKDVVTMADFEMAKDKVMMGAERRSMVISEQEKRTTAWHEAGHALVAKLLEKNSDPVHKVTIIPRGPALGLTQQLPKEDRLSMSRDFAKARLGRDDGRPRRRGDCLRTVHDRRRQRHQTGVGPCSSDGDRIWHERRHRAHLLRV